MGEWVIVFLGERLRVGDSVEVNSGVERGGVDYYLMVYSLLVFIF